MTPLQARHELFWGRCQRLRKESPPDVPDYRIAVTVGRGLNPPMQNTTAWELFKRLKKRHDEQNREFNARVASGDTDKQQGSADK